MSFKTADLCDQHSDHLQIAEPLLRHFGGRQMFSGEIATIDAFEDNSLVRQALEEPGRGRVLVVDGHGSLRCAMLGDILGALAQTHGWSGVVVYGCVRDSVDLGTLDVGVLAVATHPLKSVKRGAGRRDVPVRFAGVTFTPGHVLYADEDGLIVSETPLLPSDGD